MKQEPQLVIEDLAAAMIWEMPEHPLLEFRRGCGLFQGILCKIEVIDRFVIERFAGRHAMPWKYDAVRKIVVSPERCAPGIETALAQKQMSAVVNEILHDDRARIG